MSTRYFLTDLDGTLLRTDASLSPFSVQVLTEALSAAHVVSFATARSLTSARRLVGAVPWQYPAITYNGGVGITPFLFLIDAGGVERAQHETLHNDGMRSQLASRPDYFFLSVGHPQANKRAGVRKWVGATYALDD